MIRQILISLLMSLLFVFQASAREGADNALPYGITDHAYEEKKKQESSPWEETNPLKLFLTLGISLYQNVFSDLDGSTCQFRPSCSHFGAKAVKEHGIQGLFMASDRLLRCNGFTAGRYPVSKDGVHYEDSVSENVLWE
ncbi:MAG: membrane protein insertion efficiency factor YidD [Fibrobacterota bacterium]